MTGFSDKSKNDKSLNSTSIQNVKFTCKYDPPKLINQLNSFINEIMIQDSIFDTKKSLKDSVFDMINKKEKEELIEFLSNEKNNYINKISYYLNNKQNLNFNGLAVKLMNEENYFDTYKEKVKNEITKIKNDEKKAKTNAILDKTFFECMEHFRGTKYYEELSGLEIEYERTVENLKDQYDDDYVNNFIEELNHFEELLKNKKSRKSRKNKGEEKI